MSETKELLQKNLEDVEARIAAACARAGRDRSEVTLVAITKYVNAEVARLLFELGVVELGESRPQELWKKAAAIPEARWHLVGHLQRNKVARTLPVVAMIHSVDSLRLLVAIEAEAARQRRSVDVLLEFNLSGEAAKHGFPVSETDPPSPRERIPLAERKARESEYVRIRGLMTMAALEATPEEARRTFARLRRLSEQIRERMAEPARFPILSMGMTNDFEIAIEEGATHVRIGSALFKSYISDS
jgi:hypothetical protein